MRALRPSLRSLLAAAIALAALAAPAAAAGPTVRYVDDDGTASATGCDGARAVPSSIQAALDASRAGDIVRVCPGRYDEQVSVTKPGIRLFSVRPWEAVVRTPATLTGTRPALLTVTGDGVQVQWLRLLAQTAGSCERLDAAVRVAGGAQDVLLRSLRIAPTGSGDSRFGPCGVSTGVRVDGTARATILNTSIKGFRREGILSAPGSTVDVDRTSVRFAHPNAVHCAACAGVAGVPYQSEIGIRLRGAGSVVDTNVMGHPSGSPQSILIGIGIQLDGPATARRNLVQVAAIGVVLAGPGRVVNNRVQLEAAGFTAIEVRGAGGVVRGNIVGDTLVYGIAATVGSHDNLIRDNQVFDTYGIHCYDATGTVAPSGGTLDPIDNTWTGNIGYLSQPAGLCQAPG